jgi:hypothetical protein
MDRRLVITALACWPLGGLRAEEEAPRPRHKISAGQLYEALSARFPLRFGFGGLLQLQVSAQRLLLLPARNQLGAALLAQVSGPQVPQSQAGELELVFALRYEAADQTIRAHGPQVLDLRWPGLPPDTLQAVQALLPAMGNRIGEVVLHRFTPRELIVADTMGFEPETITVADDGLVILFGPKPRR